MTLKRFVVLAIIGFIAQLIDGSLGMAYGVSTTTLLLMFGIAPSIASASVHMAEVVTTAASGISHFRFGNVDKQVVKGLILPGSIGAFVGACFLSALPGSIVKPYISGFLLLLGIYILFRFLFDKNKWVPSKVRSPKKGFLAFLGLFAGFADATGGGGWGPMTTPILLSRKDMEARKVIGSVDTSEFAIALSATIGFLISLGWQKINWTWVFALMVGGIVAAPIAAWIIKVMPSHLLGVLVGGLIILTNTKNLLSGLPVIPQMWHGWIYAFLVLVWIVALGFVIIKQKTEKSTSTQSQSID